MKKSVLSSILVAVVLLAVGVRAEAQQAGKIPRVGIVIGSGSEANNSNPIIVSFRQALGELGYVEGKNISLQLRSAKGKGPEHAAALARELVRLKVDVLVVTPLPAIRAAKEATKTIPIVMVTSADPVASGLVNSLARPGANVTGTTRLIRELSGKRLEVLKEVVPSMSRVGILQAAVAITAEEDLKRYEAAALALNLQIHALKVRTANPDYPGVFEAAATRRVDAIIAISYGVLNRHAKQIAELAIKNRMPMMFERSVFTEWGGLVSYTASEAESFRRAAIHVDKILKGTKPADIPVEQPTKFELVINLKTANQIGLTIPPNVLARAERVIK